MTNAHISRLTIGLPVYNGARYLAEALESLLGQTYGDFELIISDNASTDDTSAICHRYAAIDARVRYVRQPRNVGCAANHRFLVEQCRTELFKWAASDDIYARDLVERCVALLDAHPEAVLAHSWTAMVVGDTGEYATPTEYRAATGHHRPSTRFRSMLFDDGGDDDYGVMRVQMLRRTPLHGSYHHGERPMMAELALLGPFCHVPDWLFLRRDHPAASRRAPIRDRCVNFDPRRARRLRHPVPRLLAEYVWAYISAIRRAPLAAGERLRCYGHLLSWTVSRARRPLRPGGPIDSAGTERLVPVSIAAAAARGDKNSA